MAKCANCGYLSVRSLVDYSLMEASSDFRERGAIALGRDDRGMNQHWLHEHIPLCFARFPYLEEATKNIKRKDNPYEEVKAIIQTEFECSEFTKWHLGFTPKEHYEMLDRDKTRKWQEGREEEDRRFRIQMANNEREWQAKQQWRLALIAGIFTIIGAIVAYFINLLISK